MGGIFGRYLAQGLDKWKSTWSWSNASGTVDLLECYTPLHVYGYIVQVCINNKLLALPLSLPFVLGPMHLCCTAISEQCHSTVLYTALSFI